MWWPLPAGENQLGDDYSVAAADHEDYRPRIPERHLCCVVPIAGRLVCRRRTV